MCCRRISPSYVPANRHVLVALAVLLTLRTTFVVSPAPAAIYRWDNGQLITDKDAKYRARLNNMNLAKADLVDANLYRAAFQESDLTDAHLMGANLARARFYYATLADADLTGATVTAAEFSGKDLSNARLNEATLTGADFTDAIVTGTSFNNATSRGFTAAQLYSTASYREGNMAGMSLDWDDLTGWDLSGKDMTGARFYRANLTNMDLSGANLTLAYFSHATTINTNLNFAGLRGSRRLVVSTSRTKATIGPDGRIEGLQLDAGERLTVRNYTGDDPIPVHVEGTMRVDPEASLRVVFDDNAWVSTISFAPGVDITLGGSLELVFADGTDPAQLFGTTFDLFNWQDTLPPAERFDQIVATGRLLWDTRRLYTTGQVRLLGIPEPSALCLTAVVLLLVVACRGRGERLMENDV